MTVESNGHRIFLEGIASLDPHTKEYMSDECYRKEMLDQGLQFLTDVDHDGTITLRMHDGEESANLSNSLNLPCSPLQLSKLSAPFNIEMYPGNVAPDWLPHLIPLLSLL